MSILEREYPKVDFRLTVVDRLYPKAVNLFRDESFRPFYGKGFTETSFAGLRNYDMTVFRTCGPNQLKPEEQATLQRFRVILERPFILNAGSFSYQEVVAGIAERQALVRWRDDAMREMSALPSTLEGFDKLDGYSQKGKIELEKLWPSEQTAFFQSIDSRRQAMPPLLADQLIQAAGAIPPGPDGGRQIRRLRASYDRSLQGLEPAAKAKLNARLDEMISASMRDIIEQQKAKLARLPKGIDGALAAVAWRRDFDIEMAGVTPTPEMQTLQAQGLARRREALAQGMPEFKTLVAQYPKPGRNGRKADDLIAELFRSGDAQVEEATQYRSLLSARTDQLKAEEQAKEAQARKAKAAAAAPPPPTNKTATAAANSQAHPCDTLAGHPGDPGHKGDGVSDADLVPAEAIKQCTLAVKLQPKNGRFKFQLGRAYWIAREYPKAVDAFLAAEELKYPPAYYYLGLAYEQGRVKGEKPDKDFAAELQQMAASEGFLADAEIAGNTAAQPVPVVEKAEDLDPAVFKEPKWVRALFSGDLAALNVSRSRMLSYARGMQEFISLNPNEYDPTCAKLADASLGDKLDFEQTGVGDGRVDMGTMLSQLKRAMGTTPGMMVATAQRDEQMMQNGVDDMNVLSQDYGSCAGPVVQRVYATLRRFVKEKPQPQQPTQPARLASTRDRPPQPEDVRGVSDPLLLARLRQELQGISAQGFIVTECTYSGGDGNTTVGAHWKNSAPPLSDSLRAAMPGVVPAGLAHCGKYPNYAESMWASFRAPNPRAQFVETAIRLNDLRTAVLPRMLPPNQQAYAQEVAAMQTPLVSCKTVFERQPVLYWKTSLPQIGGAVNWEFLQFVTRYWGVMPVAVNVCPSSGSYGQAVGSFKDY